jgi:polyferredoxin
VLRDRGSMGREVDDGHIENVYRLQIMNTGERPHSFAVSVAGIDGVTVESGREAQLDAASSRAVPVRVRAPRGALGRSNRLGRSNPIVFTIEAQDDPSLRVEEEAVFIVPR